MSSPGNGKDGDQDHERQRAHSSHSEIHGPPADTRLKLQSQSVRIQMIPRAAAHAMLANILPTGQVTSFSNTHTQTEAAQTVYIRIRPKRTLQPEYQAGTRTGDVHERDDHSKNNAVVLDSQNASEECPSETMAISLQLHEESSDHDKAIDDTEDVTSGSNEISASHDDEDFDMELDENETQRPEDEDQEECDDFDDPYITTTPGQQQEEEEQKVDFSPDVPPADEEEPTSDKHEGEADTDSDSDLSIDREMADDSSHIDERARVVNEAKLISQPVGYSSYAEQVEPSSDSIPVIQIQQLQEGDGISFEHTLIVETQYAEGANTSTVHPGASEENKYEVIVTAGDVTKKICSGAPVTFKQQMAVCQEIVTKDGIVLLVPAINLVVEDENDTQNKESENESEPLGGEDIPGNKMVSCHLQDQNMDNDVDCNVTTKNQTACVNITSTVEDIITVQHNEAQPKEQNESNRPSEDTDRNYSKSSNTLDDVPPLI